LAIDRLFLTSFPVGKSFTATFWCQSSFRMTCFARMALASTRLTQFLMSSPTPVLPRCLNSFALGSGAGAVVARAVVLASVANYVAANGNNGRP